MDFTANRTVAGQVFASMPRNVKGSFYRAALVLLIVGAAALLFPAGQVEASLQQGGTGAPAYLQQLEGYSRQAAEYFRREEELREQERRLEESVLLHTIKRGETLGHIALMHGVTVEALAGWNNLANPNRIKAGDTLYVLTVEGTLHLVEQGDTLATVAQRYNVERQSIAAYNLLEASASLTAGAKLVIPGAEVPGPNTLRTPSSAEETKEIVVSTLASRGGGAQSPAFAWPLKGALTSFYGWRQGQFHYGLDIAAPTGSEVQAIAAGVVSYTGLQRGYGLMLVIEHGNGWSSLYAHNSRLLAQEGERVLAGQPVARVGSSGNATGPHLHLEIMLYDKKLDPLPFLQ